MYFGERFGELSFADWLPGDLDAFGGFIQVRRCVEPGANAGGAQSGLDHGAGGPFPVGAGDVHEAAGAMRVAQASSSRVIRSKPNFAVWTSFPSE